MSDTTFRTKVEPSGSEENADKKAKTPDITPSSLTDNIEVPYTEYRKQHGKPYLADYYGLGDTWQDKLGGFETELNVLDMYIRDKIDSGLIENSLDSVKQVIRKIEKQCGVNKEDRTVSKISKLSAYAEFLMKTKGL